MAMTDPDQLPEVDHELPPEKEDAAAVAPRDSEVDYVDDELAEDQLPLDLVETFEVGINLDDPEMMDDEEFAIVDEDTEDETKS
jgi:hypothetical protein